MFSASNAINIEENIDRSIPLVMWIRCVIVRRRDKSSLAYGDVRSAFISDTIVCTVLRYLVSAFSIS